MTRRILVTGSRDWDDISAVHRTLYRIMQQWGTDIVVVHGDAKGADEIAGDWGHVQGVRVEAHPADWTQYGKRAGFIRNDMMVKLGADICIAFIKNNSRGATMCRDLATKAGIPVYTVEENT